MARRKKDNGSAESESPSANKDSNTKERRKIMLEVSAELIDIEARMASLREEAAEQRGRIKSLGIKAKVFNAVHNLRKLEDEGERHADVDSYRECFEALLPGQNLDMFSHSAKGETSQDAREKGRSAYERNPEALNPFPPGTTAHGEWQEGWSQGAAEWNEGQATQQ